MELFWVVGKTDVRVSSRAFSPLKFYKPNNLLINRERSQLINQRKKNSCLEKNAQKVESKKLKHLVCGQIVPRVVRCPSGGTRTLTVSNVLATARPINMENKHNNRINDSNFKHQLIQANSWTHDGKATPERASLGPADSSDSSVMP